MKILSIIKQHLNPAKPTPDLSATIAQVTATGDEVELILRCRKRDLAEKLQRLWPSPEPRFESIPKDHPQSPAHPQRRDICWTCDGTGIFPVTGQPCKRCHGTGKFDRRRPWAPHSPATVPVAA